MSRSSIQLIAGILFSILFLWLALRGVDPHALWQAMKTFNWLWSIPFVAVTMLTMWLRAVRWRYLLLPTADIPSTRLFGPIMAGFGLNGLVPRLGEFARAYILGKKENLAFAPVFATVVVERIFDTITLLVLLAFVFTTLDFGSAASFPWSTKGELTSTTAGTIIAGIAVALFIASYYRWRTKSRDSNDAKQHTLVSTLLAAVGLLAIVAAGVLLLSAKTTFKYGQDYQIDGATLKGLSVNLSIFCGVLLAGVAFMLWPTGQRFALTALHDWPYAPAKIREKIHGIIKQFVEGLNSLRSPKLIAIIFAQSLAIWILVAWSMQMIPYGLPGMRAITLTEATAILVITCIAIIIPASPGYWGLMELGIRFSLIVLAIEPDPARAMAYALIVHGLQYFPITFLGLYYLFKDQIKIGDLQQSKKGTVE